MNVKVVRGDVCYNSHVRLAFHAVELEGAQFENGKILGLHFRDLIQKRSADVAAQKNSMPGFPQQGCNQRGSRCFSVAARNGNGAAGADGEKGFHLGGEDAARACGCLQLGREGMEPGCAENNILVKILEIFIAEAQLCTALFKGF